MYTLYKWVCRGCTEFLILLVKFESDGRKSVSRINVIKHFFLNSRSWKIEFFSVKNEKGRSFYWFLFKVYCGVWISRIRLEEVKDPEKISKIPKNFSTIYRFLTAVIRKIWKILTNSFRPTFRAFETHNSPRFQCPKNFRILYWISAEISRGVRNLWLNLLDPLSNPRDDYMPKIAWRFTFFYFYTFSIIYPKVWRWYLLNMTYLQNFRNLKRPSMTRFLSIFSRKVSKTVKYSLVFQQLLSSRRLRFPEELKIWNDWFSGRIFVVFARAKKTKNF